MRLENELVLSVLQSILQGGHNAEKALKAALRGHGGALGAQGRACVARRVLGTCCLRARLAWGLEVLGLPVSSVPHLVMMYTLFQEPAFLEACGGEGLGEEEQWWEGLIPSHDAQLIMTEAQTGSRGVLRDDVSKGQWPLQPVPRLAAQASLPLWLSELWLRDYGLDEALALAHATNTPGGTVVRVNGWRYPDAAPSAARQALASALLEEGAVQSLCDTAYSPWGLRLLRPSKVNVWGSKAYQHGGFDVQDEGSQVVALSARPGLHTHSSRGLRVVDVCAGRGGKTLALLQLLYEHEQLQQAEGRSMECGEGAVLYAHDVDARCLKDINTRLARAALPPHTRITVQAVYGQEGSGVVGGRGGDVGHTSQHSETELKKEGEGGTGSGAGDWSPLVHALGACGGDVVLVDGPCSSLGTLRRGPNVRWEIDSHSLAQYQPLQLSILEQAARLLVRPGGMLIYSTCTLRREENRDVAEKALTWPITPHTHQAEGTQTEGPLLEPWAFDEDWAQDLKMRGGGPHMLELLPHVHKSDGFFIARFRRRQHTTPTHPMT